MNDSLRFQLIPTTKIRTLDEIVVSMYPSSATRCLRLKSNRLGHRWLAANATDLRGRETLANIAFTGTRRLKFVDPSCLPVFAKLFPFCTSAPSLVFLFFAVAASYGATALLSVDVSGSFAVTSKGFDVIMRHLSTGLL